MEHLPTPAMPPALPFSAWEREGGRLGEFSLHALLLLPAALACLRGWRNSPPCIFLYLFVPPQHPHPFLCLGEKEHRWSLATYTCHLHCHHPPLPLMVFPPACRSRGCLEEHLGSGGLQVRTCSPSACCMLPPLFTPNWRLFLEAFPGRLLFPALPATHAWKTAPWGCSALCLHHGWEWAATIKISDFL